MIPTIIRNSFILCLALGSLSGCDQFSTEPKKTVISEPEVKLNTNGMLSSANLFAYTQMSEALTNAQALDSIIASFLHHPNPLSLEEAQKSWVKTYSNYLEISYFWQVPRFEKPRYNEENDTYQIIKNDLDSWPIEAGYIDYLPMYPLSGIINDLTLKITAEGIYEQHGFSDKRYASIGFHPMEFLLFGENGKRSAKDFVPQDNSVETISLDTKTSDQDISDATHENENASPDKEEHAHEALLVDGPQNHNRRREYLRLLSALNVHHLQKLTDRWEPAHGYYAKQWRQPQQLANLQRVYQAAVDTIQQDILDNHLNMLLNQSNLDDLRSPFSKQDIRNINAILNGVEILFSTEEGFIAEIKTRKAEIADKMTAQFKRLLRDMKKLPNDLTDQPLKTRKKQLASIQKDTIKLLELLYSGAATLGIPLRELPVSTS
jgi:putative iron-regulated protein